jgi:hypothetical protein
MAQQQLPTITKQWTVDGFDGVDSLSYSEQPIPELADNQVLVKREFPTYSLFPSAVKASLVLHFSPPLADSDPGSTQSTPHP